MKTVGIRNLKNSLSRYLKMVREGETVLITDRNKIIAELIPVEEQSKDLGIINKYITEQAGNGSLIKAQERVVLTPKNVAPISDADKKLISDIYTETRNGGR